MSFFTIKIMIRHLNWICVPSTLVTKFFIFISTYGAIMITFWNCFTLCSWIGMTPVIYFPELTTQNFIKIHIFKTLIFINWMSSICLIFLILLQTSWFFFTFYKVKVTSSPSLTTFLTSFWLSYFSYLKNSCFVYYNLLLLPHCLSE